MAIERQDGSRPVVPNLFAVMHQSISADVPVLCGAKYTTSRHTCKEAPPVLMLEAGSILSVMFVGAGHPHRVSFGCRNMDWRMFALGSAVFAALTAIRGKVGLSQINADLATFSGRS